MQGLFKKVNKGVYPKIPKSYTKELSFFVRVMLQVKPDNRPNCDDLLKMPILLQRMKKQQPIIYYSLKNPNSMINQD